MAEAVAVEVEERIKSGKFYTDGEWISVLIETRMPGAGDIEDELKEILMESGWEKVQTKVVKGTKLLVDLV